MTIWSARFPAKQAFHARSTSYSEFRLRAVRLWLLAAAAMIFLTLIVGGATRLTVSGLSIVEWKPVTGVLPPLSERPGRPNSMATRHPPIPRAQQRHEPGAVQESYILGMDAPAAGAGDGGGVPAAVSVLPVAGAIPPPLRVRLWIIFGGGAALGVVGWWMVSSGLSGTLTKVSQYRLAFHMTLACAIYAAILWTAQQIAPRPCTKRRGGCVLLRWRLRHCCWCRSISARWSPDSMAD